MNCTKTDFKEGEWILDFYIPPKKKINWIEWMFCHRIIHISKSDEEYTKEYPFQAIQVFLSNEYPSPPFEINEKFKKAFNLAIQKYSTEKILKLKDLKPRRKLLDLIAKNY